MKFSRPKKIEAFNNTCIRCEAFIIPPAGIRGGNFCGRKCQDAYKHLLRRRRIANKPEAVLYTSNCKNCGLEFITNNSVKIYCSKDCKNIFGRVRRGNKYTYKHRSSSFRNFGKSLLTKKSRKNISIDYLCEIYESQQGKCAISGEIMTYKCGRGKIMTNASIDKIDPNGEYVPGNIQLVCFVVNIMKFTMTKDELVTWCRKIVAQGEGVA